MIDERKLLQLISAIEEHCDKTMRKLNPNAGGQEGYDHGTYTGVKIMVARIRKAIVEKELEPGPVRKEDSEIEIVKSMDRKVYIMDDEQAG